MMTCDSVVMWEQKIATLLSISHNTYFQLHIFLMLHALKQATTALLLHPYFDHPVIQYSFCC